MSADTEAPDEHDVEFRLLEIGRLRSDNASRLEAVRRLAEEFKDRKSFEQIVIANVVARECDSPECLGAIDDVVVCGDIGTEGANLASEQYRESVRIISLVEHALQPKDDQHQRNPLPCPGAEWWRGSEEDWNAWIKPLQERGFIERPTKGKPFWHGSAGFAGIVARAAQQRGWLASYVGKEGYAAFMKTTFAWRAGKPSRTAFDKAHVTGKDKALADAVLPEYGLTAQEIETLFIPSR
jgi:hypothetical protein